ncbi:hypothetical protein OYC64_010588 [Pagothenia borchgrevinki]|uniref:Uncharacterized protein n=1 Tax=Pagothenia borchgrevinki TaxID=8213 RepID=A0ABD2GXH0_PAGBO
MANSDPEDMEVDSDRRSNFQPTPSPTPTDTSTKALMASSQDTDGVQAILSLKWSEDVPLQKCHHNLEIVLQTWSNTTNSMQIAKSLQKSQKMVKLRYVLHRLQANPFLRVSFRNLVDNHCRGKMGTQSQYCRLL